MEHPQNCPGVSSEQAGRSAPCEGCPNQQVCASGAARADDAAAAAIAAHLALVRHKLIVCSGKGGVGKSTVASLLARALAQRDDLHVGLLDIDLCGPSIPTVMGLQDHDIHQSASGWQPVYAADNLAVMSVAFLLDSPDDAVIWRGPRKNGLIKQFLRDVDWGELDYLVIDTPPGTSDEHLSVVQYLSGAALSGAVLVSTPQEASVQDVRKEISFCRKLNVPIVGVVENMSRFACPKCAAVSRVFPHSATGGVERMCSELGVRFLGSLPLDYRVAQCCDQGADFFLQFPQSPTAAAYLQVTDAIVNVLNAKMQ